MKKLIIAAFLIFLAGLSVAQQPVFKKYGKVTAEDFGPTGYEDLGYKAVILQRTKNMFFDELNGSLRLMNVYHTRIKVLEDGFSDPEFFTVRFSGRYEYERVIGSRLSVFQLNGGKVVQKKVKLKDIKTYQRDSLESWQQVSLPLLRRGDIIDWEYTLATFDFNMPPIWKSQYKYPCVAAALVTNFPDFMKYRYDLRGRDTLSIYHSLSADYQSLNYSFSPKDNPKSTMYMQGPRNLSLVVYKFHSLRDSFVVAHTVPEELMEENTGEGGSLYGNASVRMKSSSFTQNIGYNGYHYYAWQQLTHLLYVYADPDNRYLSPNEAWFRSYNPGYVIVESQNWPRFHKRLVKSPDFMKPVMKYCELPKELDNLRDADDDLDTMAVARAVYKYVRENYSWNHKMQNHLPEGLDKVHSRRSGAGGEINMAMIQLMRRMGVDAFPALAATRNFGDVDTSYANIQQFNHILACVRFTGSSADTQDRYMLLDAALPSDGPYQLPDDDMNGLVLAVDPERCFFLEITGHTSDTYNAKKL